MCNVNNTIWNMLTYETNFVYSNIFFCYLFLLRILSKFSEMYILRTTYFGSICSHLCYDGAILSAESTRSLWFSKETYSVCKEANRIERFFWLKHLFGYYMFKYLNDFLSSDSKIKYCFNFATLTAS